MRWEPRFVFLFSGHMVDAPGRADPRFPADKVSIARNAINNSLEELRAGAEDLALCGGACGGDLLFAWGCLERGLRLEVRIPFDEPIFLQTSVTFAGEPWRARFFKVKAHPKTTLLIMSQELGPMPEGIDPHSHNNLWLLKSALAWGPEKVRFICLWNRQGGDGPGGTKHMHDEIKKRSGKVYVLDTTRLW